MRKLRRHPALLIDVAGATFLVIGGALLLSMTVLRRDDVLGEIRTLDHAIAESTQGLAAMRERIDQSRAQLQKNHERLAQRGRLPDEPPVDEYFQVLSTLATSHRLNVLSHSPAGSRHYPGLEETRFAYVVSGSLVDIVRFFKAVEDSPYWADIGYLRLQPPAVASDATEQARSAQLIICLFSAEATESEAASKRG